MIEKHVSRRRQTHTTVGAHEQLDAERALETTNLTTERRLRDEQARGRTSEVQLLRDSDEQVQLSQLEHLCLHT